MSTLHKIEQPLKSQISVFLWQSRFLKTIPIPQTTCFKERNSQNFQKFLNAIHPSFFEPLEHFEGQW